MSWSERQIAKPEVTGEKQGKGLARARKTKQIEMKKSKYKIGAWIAHDGGDTVGEGTVGVGVASISTVEDDCMSNTEVDVIKLRHHKKGPWLRKRRAEEEKEEDAPHSSDSVN
ncbi:unnamed protein product [Ilex paraguariensis]|uniref:Uncharacterized protein n=1 Tax=Ilex paraguariensis TaxID=185542 RepID=A0ABC8TL93_9AQUA